MGRNLNDVIAELPPARRARIDAQYNTLKQEVESLRELPYFNGKQTAPSGGRQRPRAKK
jgi:hypothetical protein